MIRFFSLLLILFSSSVSADLDDIFVCSVHRQAVDREGRVTTECEGTIDLNSKTKKFEHLKSCSAAVELIYEDSSVKIMLFDTYEHMGKLRAFRTTIVEFPEDEIPSSFTMRILRETNKEKEVSVRMLDAMCGKI
jgi:hypothetical protein